MFLIPSLYILLVSKYKKNVFKKIDLLFDFMKNIQVFHSEIGHFEHDNRFNFSREMGNIRSCKEGCQDGIHFGSFEVT